MSHAAVLETNRGLARTADECREGQYQCVIWTHSPWGASNSLPRCLRGGIDCLNIRLFFNRQADTVLDIGYLF